MTNEQEMTESAAAPALPPAPPSAPPRHVTPTARRRAWADPRVRFWWISASVLFAAALYLLVSRSLAWHEDSRLSISGTQVQATVLQADESVARGKTVNGDKPVKLSYEFAGKPYEVSTPYLDGRKSEQFIVVGSTIPIRIDPANPERWTPRDSPAPLAPELIGGAITLTVAIALALFSYWMRSRVLRTWRDAAAVPAMVLGARHTALAPSAWTVRCTPVEEGDDRVVEVFEPARSSVEPGAVIWILAPETGRALAAKWFEGRRPD
jgi:uncharacterized protein DUF3592